MAIPKMKHWFGVLQGYWFSAVCGICEEITQDLEDTMSVWLFRGKGGFNTLKLRQNGCRLADYIFKCIFFNKDVWISIKVELMYVPKDPIDNKAVLVWVMAWHQTGYKPLSEPMMT